MRAVHEHEKRSNQAVMSHTAATACAWCSCPAPTHAFCCPHLVLPPSPAPYDAGGPGTGRGFDGAPGWVWDRAEHRADRDIEREFEADEEGREPDMWRHAP